MRVRPRPLIGVVIAVAYAALFVLLELAIGVDYDEIGDSTSNIVRGIVIPVGILAVLLAVVTTWLGWWRPAMSERPTAPRWLWIVPALMLVSSVVQVATGDLGSYGAELLVVLAVGTLLVGFAEELLTRGLAVVGFRGGMGEVGVWFWSSLLFGLLHGINVFLGQGVGLTVRQVVFAFLFGTVLYVIRRVSGVLVLCMLLHAFWDFSIFAHSGSEASTTADPSVAAGLMGTAAVVVALIGLRRVVRTPPEPSGAAGPGGGAVAAGPA